MSQKTLTPTERYVAAFEALEKDGLAREPSWARVLRHASMARFIALGFPTARRGNEEWKYTDVGPIARASLEPVVEAAPDDVLDSEVEQFSFGDAGWPRLVFMDGAYAPHLSSTASLPRGVRVVDLAQAVAEDPTLVEKHLARHADYEAHPFTALNTAFVHHGAFVHVPDSTLVEQPIHLLFLSPIHEQGTVSHPRVLVLVGRGSKATIVESYGGLGGGRYFTNAVTEVVVGANASVRYYKAQHQSEQAFHIGTTQVELGRDSAFESVTVDVGGGLVRNNLNVVMAEEGSSCVLNGLYLVAGTQHVDNQVIIDHVKGHTTARELYKGVLDGKSRSVFHGSIIVREGAQKVDAHQEDKNLLLSDEAEADTKPAFWIYANDVKCGHGAACGKLDENELFYLRSRGIPEPTARSMLTRAFVSAVIGSVSSEPVRARLDDLVTQKLQAMLKDEGTL